MNQQLAAIGIGQALKRLVVSAARGGKTRRLIFLAHGAKPTRTGLGSGVVA
jgi:hypothetical protein